jgi:hypothetical protein
LSCAGYNFSRSRYIKVVEGVEEKWVLSSDQAGAVKAFLEVLRGK